MSAVLTAEHRQIAAGIAHATRLRSRDPIATVDPWGFPMEVEHEYHKAQAAVLWGDYPEPGNDAGASVIACRVGGVDITDMLTDAQHQTIEAAIVRQMEA